MKPARLILVAALLLGGCLAPKPSVMYTSFGEARLAADKQVVDRYIADYERRHPETTAPSGYPTQAPSKPDVEQVRQVKVLVDTLPEGIELKDGSIRSDAGSSHVILGRLVLKAPKLPGTMAREALVRELKYLAHEAGGNVVIMSFMGGDQELAEGAVGYVLKSNLSQLDPQKNRSGKLPMQL